MGGKSEDGPGSSKSSQLLASQREKDGTEKQSLARPRGQPLKEPSEVLTHKRLQGAKQGCCQAPRKPPQRQEGNQGHTQKPGDGGRRGHLAGVSEEEQRPRGATCGTSQGLAFPWDRTASLGSRWPRPRPTARACAAAHCTVHPALQGPGGRWSVGSSCLRTSAPSHPSHSHTRPPGQV
uniref:Uncharacterized protein n=1 Tax=Oryctolagus cuniculus TaxID=9986 RepID=A0A5F9DFG4_RABIT